MVTRRILATALFLCLTASMAESVLAQVRTARAHAVDPSPSPRPVVLEGSTGPDGSVGIRTATPDERPTHRHHDEPGHDPAGEHCAHHHIVGPTTGPVCEVAVGLMADLSVDLSDEAPADWTVPPSPEPPRG